MKKRKKYSSELPKGWTLGGVRQIAGHFDDQADEEGAAEIEMAEDVETVLIVPARLVARIRKLIAESAPGKLRQSKARRVA